MGFWGVVGGVGLGFVVVGIIGGSPEVMKTKNNL